MAVSEQNEIQHSTDEVDEHNDSYMKEEEDEEEEEENVEKQDNDITENVKIDNLLRRLFTEKLPIRVHDVLIKGNSKTRDFLIENEVEILKKATTMRELLDSAGVANEKLKNLQIFDSVNIILDSGPLELPGTVNVVVEVVEVKRSLSGDIGLFTKPEARSWSLEGSLKWKNLFGYGDIWDGSLAYGLGHTSQLSSGISFPKIKGLMSPIFIRLSLLSQDWLKYSSFKEQSLGLSLGLISTKNSNLAYNLAWRTLTDPSQVASRSIRQQLGHSLLSSLKYTCGVDKRNSPVRPTKGYSFFSNSQIGGLWPDSRSDRFFRQEFDFRYAFPLGFYRAALNLGVSCGVTFPWGPGFMSKPSPILDRFFLGGNISPLCTVGGPQSVLGFRCRGIGPTEPRRQNKDMSIDESHCTDERDAIGGDLALTVIADISFDLPLKLLRDAGVYGHAFACAGNLTKLTENEFKNSSLRKFWNSFRSSAGVGIVLPINLLRVEVNYCYIVRQMEYDKAKNGVQLSFSGN